MLDPVASSTDVHKVHTELLHFTDVDFALLKTPVPPLAILALLRTFSPVGSADTHEQGLVGPSLAYTISDLQRKSQAVLE